MKPLTSSQFLKAVWPQKLLTHETLELRVIDRVTQRIHRKFATSIPEFLSHAQKYADFEVYFGVSTRFMQGGKKENCYRVNTVWVDLDNKKLSECLFDPKPNILVESGGGIHAYWVFESPVLVKDERWGPIENINRGLAKAFGGDIAAIDVSRILRCPQFLNHKYSPARPVKAYAL
jgi:hypothetical protein